MSKLATLKEARATDPGTRGVIVARYGFDGGFAVRHKQRPHLSVTCTVWEPDPRTGRFVDVSGGVLGAETAGQFFAGPIAGLVPFHLHDAPTGEPMHYVANAVHWHEHVTGAIARHTWHKPADDTAEKGRAYFLSHVCADVPGCGPVPLDVFGLDSNGPELRAWLAERLPIIREAMRAACAAAGLAWPNDAGEIE